ncbi:hypothetical protein [Pandoraea soli]
MMNGIQAFHYSPGLGNVAAAAPIALAPEAGLANAAGIPLVRIANARGADSLAHPWMARAVHAVPVSRGMDKAFGNDFLGVSAEVEASGDVAPGRFISEGGRH